MPDQPSELTQGGSMRPVECCDRARARRAGRETGGFRRAIGGSAIDRARYVQVGGQGKRPHGCSPGICNRSKCRTRERLSSPQYDGAVGGPARVVDGVGPRALVAAQVRFHDIPVKQRERFVEVGDAVGVGRQSVGVVPSRNLIRV